MPTLNQLIHKGRKEKRRTDRTRASDQCPQKQVYFTPFLILICFCYLVAGVLNVVWFPGEVASPLIILGGASAIYFYFFAKSFEQRSPSLLSFVLSNILIFYVFQMPDPCSFLVGLFLIFLAAGHLFLWLSSEVFFNFIFFVVLLSRIFFHQKMGEWGFGLVTEFMFLSFLFEFLKKERSKEGSRIFPVLYFLLLFLIAFFYNFLFLDCSLKQILIQINFLFAAAALLFFSFFAETIKELRISFFLYVIGNCSIGYFLTESIMTFCIVTSVFLLSNGVFASFFFLKAKMEKRPLSDILLANNREGIHIVLVVYFLVLGVLLTQLKLDGSADLSSYSNWLFGLGIQIGYLSVFHYFFRKSNEKDL